MPFLSKPSGAARMSIAYITTGALIDVWTIIYWAYLSRHPDGHSDAAYYWVYGFFFTGLVLLVIGLALGRIGRAARHAELPPDTSNEPASDVNGVGVVAQTPALPPPGSVAAPQYYAIPAPAASPAQPVPTQATPVPALPVAATRPTR